MVIVDLFDDLLQDAFGDRVEAGALLAERLMLDDPVAFKSGYTAENAAMAAQTAFGLDDWQYRYLLRRLSGDTPDAGELQVGRGLHDDEFYVYRWDISQRLCAGEGCWNPVAGPWSDPGRAYDWIREGGARA